MLSLNQKHQTARHHNRNRQKLRPPPLLSPHRPVTVLNPPPLTKSQLSSLNRQQVRRKQNRKNRRNRRNLKFAVLKSLRKPSPLSRRLALVKIAQKRTPRRKKRKTNGFVFAGCRRQLPIIWTPRCPCRRRPPYETSRSKPLLITVPSSITTCSAPVVGAYLSRT